MKIARTVRRGRGFTLVEVLLAVAILTVLLLILTSLLSSISRAWTVGEQQVAEFQDGRAVLELISRELSQAAISPNLQLIHDPSLGGAPQRANSDCIFWQGPATSTSNGDIAEIGYYLSENLANPEGDAYQLKRFFVPPSDAINYQVFTSPNQPSDTDAKWVTNYVTNANLNSTVATGVIAFWVRCLDKNGDPIPWPPTNAGGRFNSAAHFQPAVSGQPNSFKYTNAATTARANLLPSIIELSLVTLDPRAFKQKPSIPGIPAEVDATDFPNVRDTFNQDLIANKVKTARTFTTRVHLLNAD